MQKLKAFLIAFYCQLVPSIVLAWSLGAKDLGNTYATLFIGPSYLLLSGVLDGLLSSIMFGALMAACVERTFSRPLISHLTIIFLFTIFSAYSIKNVADDFEQAYGATWYPGESFFELGLGSSITFPAYFFGLLTALVLLSFLRKGN